MMATDMVRTETKIGDVVRMIRKGCLNAAAHVIVEDFEPMTENERAVFTDALTATKDEWGDTMPVILDEVFPGSPDGLSGLDSVQYRFAQMYFEDSLIHALDYAGFTRIYSYGHSEAQCPAEEIRRLLPLFKVSEVGYYSSLDSVEDVVGDEDIEIVPTTKSLLWVENFDDRPLMFAPFTFLRFASEDDFTTWSRPSDDRIEVRGLLLNRSRERWMVPFLADPYHQFSQGPILCDCGEGHDEFDVALNRDGSIELLS